MTDQDTMGIGDSAPKRPRIAIMGEFSAGKSTLMNLLLGEPALPVKVTATQLPPVWISRGSAPPVRVALDGSESPVDLNDVASIPVAETRWIRIWREADALEMCDLIDMPGISDPNMPPEVWERVVDQVDAVIWCTHATQAWRQSEDAVWSEFPPEIQEKSLLLITRFDKIVAERDRQRLVRRVKEEVEGLFRGVYPISLTEAIEAGDDDTAWVQSGADAFATALIELTQVLSPARKTSWTARPPAEITPAEDSPARPLVGAPLRAVAPPSATDAPAPIADVPSSDAEALLRAADAPPSARPAPVDAASEATEARVLPQRVRLRGASPTRSRRPERPPSDDAAQAG